jgi:hypothetical protein
MYDLKVLECMKLTLFLEHKGELRYNSLYKSENKFPFEKAIPLEVLCRNLYIKDN